MGYLTALKFDTQKGGVRAHLGTKIGQNTINTCKVICDYLQNITPICCHTHKVDCAWLEAEKLVQRQVNYQASNLLWFERNRAKDHKDTAKNQQCV